MRQHFVIHNDFIDGERGEAGGATIDEEGGEGGGLVENGEGEYGWEEVGHFRGWLVETML